jgi:hypothetical protein
VIQPPADTTTFSGDFAAWTVTEPPCLDFCGDPGPHPPFFGLVLRAPDRRASLTVVARGDQFAGYPRASTLVVGGTAQDTVWAIFGSATADSGRVTLRPLDALFVSGDIDLWFTAASVVHIVGTFVAEEQSRVPGGV